MIISLASDLSALIFEKNFTPTLEADSGEVKATNTATTTTTDGSQTGSVASTVVPSDKTSEIGSLQTTPNTAASSVSQPTDNSINSPSANEHHPHARILAPL